MRNENCDKKSSCDDYKHNHCEGCGGNKPKGDLISRDALKKAIDDYAEKRQDTLLWQADIDELIDNAPTVEPEITNDDLRACMKESHHLGYELAEIKFKKPQGEWIEVEPTEEDKEYGFDTRIVCSRCYEPDSHFDYDEYHKPKAVWYFRPNFCPNCGADMRGKEK